MLYSKQTGGFYHEAIHGAAIPADAVEIDDDAYRDLMRAQSGGKQIRAGQDGRPVAEVAAPSNAETAAAVRGRRNSLLAESDWVVLRSLEQGVPVPPEWRAYRQKLRDMTDAKKFPKVAEKDWPAAPAEPD